MRPAFKEYPSGIQRSLFFLIWGLLILTVFILLTHWNRLEPWKVSLYACIFAAYLIAERRAYQAPLERGRRVHEWLRYALSFAWWSLMIGSPLVYALKPVSQIAFTVFGAGLSLAGLGLRVWSVHTLGQYFSGHIESFDRQPLVDQGPYRFIRHPAYLGNLLQVVGMPLILNAYPVLLLSMFVAAIFLRRMLWEEEYLAQNLSGYQVYMRRTKRVIPGIW